MKYCAFLPPSILELHISLLEEKKKSRSFSASLGNQRKKQFLKFFNPISFLKKIKCCSFFGLGWVFLFVFKKKLLIAVSIFSIHVFVMQKSFLRRITCRSSEE